MTAEELLPLILAAIGGGLLSKIADPIVKIILARGQGKKLDAEASKIEAEASKSAAEAVETPFKQAAWIITDLRERVKMLEQAHDTDRKQQEGLLVHLADCERKNVLLSQRILKLEQGTGVRRKESG